MAEVYRVAIALKDSPEARLTRFHVIGDVEYVLKALRAKGSSLVEEPEGQELVAEKFEGTLRLDPGGGALMNAEEVDFTLQDVDFNADTYKLSWIHEELSQAPEDPPGYWRLPVSNGAMRRFIFMKDELRQEMLCQLLSYEFAPGVKEARDDAKRRSDNIFHRGISARRDENGNWIDVRGKI